MALRLTRFAFVLALSCTSSVTDGGGCLFDSDCASGQVCAARACRAACRTDADCGAGARCVAGEAPGTAACIAPVGGAPACARDSDCGEGLACLAGRCVAQCQTDYDCRAVNPSLTCAAGRCQLVCGAGTAQCDGVVANGCERLDTLAHCGRCGNACRGGANASPRCAAGQCALACAAGFGDCDGAADTGCETPLTTTTHCGRCGGACPRSPNGTAVCADGACGLRCDAGFALRDGACVAVPAPRLVGPRAGVVATTRRPTFRWAHPAGSANDGARVELCRDRACATVLASFEASGTSGSPTAPLAPGVYFWRAFGRVGAVTGTAASSATGELVVPARDAARAGAWGVYPDFDADGFADAVVGEPGRERVHVYRGATTGLPAAPTATLTGPGKSRFGTSAAAVGDVDGDGFGDVVVAAPDVSELRLFRGGASGLSQTGVAVSLPSGGSPERVAAAGDIDGDGYADVLAFVSDEVPSVALLRGGAMGLEAPVTVTSGGAITGAVAGLGQADDDAFDDIAVLARGAVPEVRVFSGGAGGFGPNPRSFAVPAGAGALAAAGDVDGDGFGDLLVGNDGESTGSAWLHVGSAAGLGATAARTFTNTSVGAFGTVVAGLGDVNGDGFADFAVSGASRAVTVVFGGASVAALTTASLDGGAGPQVKAWATPGDYDRDGFFDPFAGAPDFANCASAALLWRGARTLTVSPARAITPPGAMVCASEFGVTLAWRWRAPRWPAG